MRVNYKSVIFSIILFFIGFQSFGQQNYIFNNISVSDGLSSHVIFSIENDNSGMIWSLSSEGVDRYDGNSFKHYPIVDLEGNVLGSFDRHSGFFKDKFGTIWLYTKQGIFTYDEDLDKFVIFNTLKENGSLSKSFYKITQLGENFVFFSWSALYIWNPKLNDVKRHLLNHKVEALCSYGENSLLLGLKDGLVLFDGETFKATNFKGDNLNDFRIRAIYKNNNSDIWIGTRNNGLYLLREEVISKILDGNSIPILDIDKYENKIIVATDGNGVLFFDEQSKEQLDFDPSNSLLDATQFYSIYTDKKLGIWLGTYGMGLYYFVPNNPTLYPYNRRLINSNKIKHGYAAFRDNLGNLLLGTDNGLIIDDNSGNPIVLTKEKFGKKYSSVGNFAVNSIRQDDKNNYWISTYGHGIFEINQKTSEVNRKITSINIGKKRVPINNVISLEFINGKLWINLVDGALFSYDLNSGKAVQLPFNKVKFIYQPKKGKTIYIATPSGVFSLENSEKKFRFKAESEIKDYLVLNDSTSIIGTESNGIKKLNHNDFSLEDIESETKLPNDITDMLYVNDSTLILLGDNAVYNIKMSSSRNYVSDVKTIIQRFEANKNSNIIHNGKLILGGYEAISVYPIDKTFDIYSPKIFFDRLEVGNTQVIPGESDILEKRIDKAESLVLKHPERAFKIDLNIINFSKDYITYSWRLNGLDEKFAESTSSNVVTYNNIPYGSYTLEVKAKSGFLNKEISSRKLDIVVLAPFWATNFAYTIYSFLILAILIGIYSYYWSLKKQKTLQERNSFFAELAHEIRNPLTLIKGPIQQLSELNISDDGKKIVEGVSINLERLNKRLNQLLDFERGKSIGSKVRVQKFDAIKFVKKLVKDFDPILEKKNIELVTVFKEEQLLLLLDKAKLEKIIYNLISNAIKYSNNDSKITLTISSNDDTWNCVVEDFGMGIPVKNQKHIFKRFYRAENAIKSGISGSGIGLILSYKYTVLMNGTLTFQSKENVGTKFTLKLPLSLGDEESDVPDDVSYFEQESTFEENKKYDYKIAIAEDNDELREFLVQYLSKKYDVVDFSNGKECYDSLVENEYDLVLSDIMMPEMNGYELCDKIKGNIETSHLPIILLTALNSSMYKAEGYEHGADHYVNKPFDIKMLNHRIISLIENRIKIKKRYQENVSTGVSVNEEIPVHNTIDSTFLEAIDKLVVDNISNHDYSVKEICIDMGMSRPVIYRKLKALTDLSPKEYIQNKRLLRAKLLLETTNDPINIIAYDSGYSDPKYFSTAFKKKFSLSPSEYAKKISR